MGSYSPPGDLFWTVRRGGSRNLPHPSSAEGEEKLGEIAERERKLESLCETSCLKLGEDLRTSKVRMRRREPGSGTQRRVRTLRFQLRAEIVGKIQAGLCGG